MAALFERMKAAWDSRAPDALDREAEDMARRGVAEADIYAALEELLLAVRESGADDETEERINEVMDRLTGWCHPSSQIRTVRDTLPTKAEIAELPRWARVAFAARCARRALPLFVLHRPDAPRVRAATLREGVGWAEQAATHGFADPLQFAQIVEQLGAFDTATVGPAYHAVTAVYVVASGADDVNLNAEVVQTVTALGTLSMAIFDGLIPVQSVIRRDFNHLASLARWLPWTDDTPVPPEVFGPLWPEGPPKGWPPVTDAPPRAELALELFPRDRATDRMIEDDIVHLFNTLNRYHIARSGVRLTLEQFRSLLPALVPAEV